MKSLNEMTAESIARTDMVTVSSDQSLSKIKALMDEHDLREIPVVNDGELKGMISYREFIDKIHLDPTNTNAETVMHQPPKAEPGMNLIELACLRRDSGRKRSVLLEGNRLKGVVGEEDMIYPLTNSVQELHNLRVKDLMNTALITLEEDDKHAKAIELMRENNISRIPVVDSRGMLTGLITSLDSLRTMEPREQMKRGDVKGYKEELSDVPCRELMNTSPPTIKDRDEVIPKAIRRMEKLGSRELIVVDKSNTPEGIITLRDIIDYIATLEDKKGIMVNLIGVENQGQIQQVHDKLETAVKGRLSRILEDPRELNLHVKQYEKDGKRRKYSVNARMFSELGITVVHKHGWELLDVVDEIIDSIAERTRKEKEKRRDRIREQWRRGKYNK